MEILVEETVAHVGENDAAMPQIIFTFQGWRYSLWMLPRPDSTAVIELGLLGMEQQAYSRLDAVFYHYMDNAHVLGLPPLPEPVMEMDSQLAEVYTTPPCSHDVATEAFEALEDYPELLRAFVSRHAFTKGTPQELAREFGLEG